jgi:acyl-CoA synthetase (NDP forming)
MGKWGHMLLCNTLSGGFEGAIYPVNPKGGIIAGKKAYRSVADLPTNVDLAVVTVPASKVMELIDPLARKEIRNMLLITSGFGETDSEGKQREKALVHMAREAGILLLGPNTMGICNPHIKFYCTASAVRPVAGSTTIVSQSGNMGTQLLAFAEQQGIGIRGFCGSGNEAMMTIEDVIEGLEVDDLTRTVILYIESVKNGRRFFESAHRVGRKKPIVLLKGGRSKAGNRAAASHTGALTSDSVVFDAVCRQAGIVKVDQPMDLLDLAGAFSSLPLPKGNRVAIMTLGGGWGVITADLSSEYGLKVPQLCPPIVDRFDKILPYYWSRSNPIDIVGERDTSIPLAIIEELMNWEGCDAVINLGILGRSLFVNRLADSVQMADPAYSPEDLEAAKSALATFEETYVQRIVSLMENYEKPVLGVSLVTGDKQQTVFEIADRRFKGIFYPTPERAVKALAKMCEYQRFLSR